MERFGREVRHSALEHPGICAVYEFGEHEGQSFIVMQLLEGQSLRERLGQPLKGPMQSGELLNVAVQIAEGLAAAHDKSIIHRDIKPANIFITNRGEAKILDFGLAKIMGIEEALESNSTIGPTRPPHDDATIPPNHNPNLTQPGIKMGTAMYMSPEQVRGERLDPRTDLFSFGLVLYEMASGGRPFTGRTELTT